MVMRSFWRMRISPARALPRRIIRADGIGVVALLDAILPFFPLDRFVERSLAMDCSEWGDEPQAYGKFREAIRRADGGFTEFEYLPRFDFYSRAEKAYVVVMTSEPDGNVILKKGPVMA